jgi:toxin HigB-1
MPHKRRGAREMAEGDGDEKTSGKAPSVFISYASQDTDAAERICDALRAVGCRGVVAAVAGRWLRGLGISWPRRLRSPPGNRLEALKGDRQGQHSIRVNDQWRICFRWTAAGPEDVEIVD